jgi:hypothetical protein
MTLPGATSATARADPADADCLGRRCAGFRAVDWARARFSAALILHRSVRIVSSIELRATGPARLATRPNAPAAVIKAYGWRATRVGHVSTKPSVLWPLIIGLFAEGDSEGLRCADTAGMAAGSSFGAGGVKQAIIDFPAMNKERAMRTSLDSSGTIGNE